MEFLVTPWAHQLQALDRTKGKDYFGLFFEVGTGKTATAISILRQKMSEEKRLLRTLIVCPPIVINNWVKEFRMHSKLKNSDIMPLIGPGWGRRNALLNSVEYPKVYIINYEGLLMPGVFEVLQQMKIDCMILDESHRIRNPKTKKFKAVVTLSKNIKYRFLLTGTPILNSALDIFAQIRILDQGLSFGSNYYVFRNQYFTDVNTLKKGKSANIYNFSDWRIKEGAYEQISAVISPHVMYVKKEECLDLPPLIRKTLEIDLSPLQRHHYEQMKKDFITYMAGGACVANMAMIKAMRLMQIVSGFMPVEIEDGTSSIVRFEPCPRAAALYDLLESLITSHKVIVWACYKENYRTIRGVLEKLGTRWCEIHGDISPSDKDLSVERFNTDDSYRVLIGNPQAAGIGINLTAASYSVYFSRNFSLEQDLQSEARNYRGGSEIHQKITRIDLVARNTIDELIRKKLEEKVQIGDKILGDLANILDQGLKDPVYEESLKEEPVDRT